MNLFLTLIVTFILTIISSTAKRPTISRSYSQLLKKYGPIRSLQFEEIGNGLRCVAQSSLPVNYSLVIIDNNNENNTILIEGRAVTFEGQKIGRAIVGCEASAYFGGKEYKMLTYRIWHFTNDIQKYLNPFYHSYGEWENSLLSHYKNVGGCFNLINSTNQEHLAEIMCYSSGYLNVEKASVQITEYVEDVWYNRYNRQYQESAILSCEMDAQSLDDCSLDIEKKTINRRTRSNRYYKNCTRIKADCVIHKSSSPSMSDKSKLKPVLSVKPEGVIEENDIVTITCSTEFKYYYKQMIQLHRIKSNGERIRLITSFDDFTIRQTSWNNIWMSFTYLYRATRDSIKDTFICTVSDLMSLSSRSIHKTVTYKIAFTNINIKLLLRDNTSNIVEVTNNLNLRSQADMAECRADSEQPPPLYEWIYLDRNGNEATIRSNYLNLTNVEKRVGITCRVQQNLRSAIFNGSVNISFYENDNNSTARGISYLKVLRLCNQKDVASCPKQYDLVFKSIQVGYVSNCQDNLEGCYLNEGIEYYRTERCFGVQVCDVSTSVFKKMLFSALMKSLLPKTCFSGNKPFMELSYYCLKKVPTL